ncbi:MAG: hypothetical protein ACM31P_07110, partial [Actinomycetota bacterium]
ACSDPIFLFLLIGFRKQSPNGWCASRPISIRFYTVWAELGRPHAIIHNAPLAPPVLSPV